MISPIILLVIVILSLNLAKCHKTEWQQHLLYGTTANLTCGDDNFKPGQSSDSDKTYLWILPNTEVINETKMAATQHYSFLNNGSVLLVHDIDKPDFGIYHCLVLTGSGNILSVVKLGINIDGPYFGNLWELYSSNLKIGLISGFIVLIVMGMFCYNYDQFQAKHDILAARERKVTSLLNEENKPREMFYRNPVFVDDGNEICCKAQDDCCHGNNVHMSGDITEVKSSF